jgi:hypothetical protein
MGKSRSAQESHSPRDSEPQLPKDYASLWQPGALFHAFHRYPRRPDLPRVDRLAGILRNGLIAPASCRDGSVCSDLRITVTGTELPYDSLIFLHRFGPQSGIYMMAVPGRVMVFLDPATPVLTPESMRGSWPLLCQDEVYVRDRVPPEALIGVVVHPADAGPVAAQFAGDFRRLGIPLYDYHGTVLCPP